MSTISAWACCHLLLFLIFYCFSFISLLSSYLAFLFLGFIFFAFIFVTTVFILLVCIFGAPCTVLNYFPFFLSKLEQTFNKALFSSRIRAHNEPCGCVSYNSIRGRYNRAHSYTSAKGTAIIDKVDRRLGSLIQCYDYCLFVYRLFVTFLKVVK